MLSNSIIVGFGPPSGISVSYIYQPWSTVAFATISTSPLPASSIEKFQEIGSWAKIENVARKNRDKTDKTIFLFMSLLFCNQICFKDNKKAYLPDHSGRCN